MLNDKLEGEESCLLMGIGQDWQGSGLRGNASMRTLLL